MKRWLLCLIAGWFCFVPLAQATTLPLTGAGGGSGAAAPSVVNTNTSADTATNHTVNLPASIVANNLLVIVGGLSSGAGNTLSTPSGWSALTSSTSSSAKCYVFYKTASGSEGSTVTVSSAISDSVGFNAYQISGWDASTPQFGTWGTGTSTAPNPPSVTPSTSASLALAIAGGGDATVTMSYPSGYSNGIVGNVTSNGFAASAQKTLSGTSPEHPGVFGTSSSVNWCAQTVIVN